MTNLELLILCALRQMFYREELDTKYLDKVQLTSQAKKVVLNDVSGSMFTFEEYNKDIDLEEIVKSFPVVEQIELDTNELNYFYLKAMQYAIGRHSYIVSVALEWTQEYLNKLSGLTQAEVITLLDKHLKKNKNGTFYENVVWEQIRDLLLED